MSEIPPKTIGDLDEAAHLRLEQLEEERQARWRRLEEVRRNEERRKQEAEATRWREMLEKPNSVEALSWLQDPIDKHRSYSGDDGTDGEIAGEKLLRLVKRLYGYGAVRVTAVDIQGYGESGEELEDTDTLVVELPDDAAARRRLFRWEAAFAQKDGWTPTPDTGQQYLLLWRD